MKCNGQTIEQGFFVAGVNYRTAPVDVRERMAVAHADRVAVSRKIQAKAGLDELVVLWTCNRVEIYGMLPEGARPDLDSVFACLAREVPSLSAHVYCHHGREALRHLFRVAGGLDSMVLGETQITGQVRDSYEQAREADLAGKMLNSVFQTALRAAKAMRTQTSLGRGARSVGGMAVAHAREALGSEGLGGIRVLMIGAGEMATCCLRHLQKKGMADLKLANRSLDRARELAAEFKGEAIPLDRMYDAMVDADVVISSTGSPQTIIHRSEMEAVMQRRAGARPLVMIDIAVPRDIDPAVASIEGIHLHDIDALESTVQQTMDRWEQDLALCEAIIEEEINTLMLQLKSRRAAANRFHDRAQAACGAERAVAI